MLNVVTGRPAQHIPVRLERACDDGTWSLAGNGHTDEDGRLSLPVAATGLHRLSFITSSLSTFYPEVTIQLMLAEDNEPYHVPLLVSPFAFSTYKGS
ncbi:MAG TPA: hydroxyisourate hydrolase [Streptosporangiaceae bacterium]|nr:hydroxyisourate hydrolase [Streptosporangiaceae bacterium]